MGTQLPDADLHVMVSVASRLAALPRDNPVRLNAYRQLVTLFHTDGTSMPSPRLAMDDERDDVEASLPPRLQRVFRELIRSGDGEKQIAIRLGLSRHTVHEYVK